MSLLCQSGEAVEAAARLRAPQCRDFTPDQDDQTMEAFLDLLRTFATELAARPEGPMAFRFILQPLMSLLMATRDGVKDAKTGKSPYLWHLASTDKSTRRESLREGLRSTGRIVLIGIAIDLVYQYKAMDGVIRPLEAVTVALTLGFLPYLLFRGPIARLARLIIRRRGESPSE